MSAVDLLVAGGGPAGSTLAALAADAGARVVLVEREGFPRDKLCGEFVSVEGRGVLERLGVMETLLEAGATRMGSIRLSSLRGREVTTPLPDVPGVGRDALGISRRVLDAVLLERARRSGVEVRERFEAVAPVMDGEIVRGLRVRRAGASHGSDALRATVTVAADGRRSMLVRALHPGLSDPLRSEPRSWFALKTHLAVDASRLENRIELHLFDGGYAGLGCIEGGRVNLCLMVTVRALRANGGSPDRLLREHVTRNPALAAVLAGGDRVTSWKSIGPLRFGPRQPTAGGALFVGDAAGTIDPYCGEGIAHALRSAEAATDYVLHAAHDGGLTPALAAAYRSAWFRAFGPSTRRVRWLGRLLESWWMGELAGAALTTLGGRLLPRLVAATRTGASAIAVSD